MTVEWARLAQPQDDGYDTRIIEEYAAKTYQWTAKRSEQANWLDGAVRLRNDDFQPSPDLLPAPFDHPNILLGEQYLRAWPAMFTQAQRLLTDIWVVDWRLAGPGGRGCFCGTVGGNGFGFIFSSVFDPVGFMEGIVHELGHWKLHALGIHFEAWDDLIIANKPEELFVSSIRKDKLRPMGAVLHAHYSYLNVLQLDLAALPFRPGEFEHQGDLSNIRLNVERTLEGQATIDKEARWTEAGAEFWKGAQAWTEQLLSQARSLA